MIPISVHTHIHTCFCYEQLISCCERQCSSFYRCEENLRRETPRYLKRRVKGRVKLARSRISRDDGTQTCREESAVVIETQKRKAIPVAYVSDSSSGTKTLNIEERLVT